MNRKLKLKTAWFHSLNENNVIFTGYKQNRKYQLSYTITDSKTFETLKNIYGKTFNIWQDENGNFIFTNIH